MADPAQQPEQGEVLRPYPGSPQERLVRSRVFEALVGGSVGGGKSLSLLMAAALYADRPRHRALLLRRTFPELRDSLLPASWLVYQPMGAEYANKTWTFPSGATVDLRSMEHEKDRFNFQSAEYTFVGWDQLETFTKTQYEFMLSRLRTTDPTLPCLVRAAANPIGPHVDWVLERWRWWLYEPGQREDEHAGPYVPPNVAAWVLRDPASGHERLVLGDEVLDCRACGARWRARDKAPPKARASCQHASANRRVFFPAKLADNPRLAATDYASRLDLLDPFTRGKLLGGDWMSVAAVGEFFSRAWFPIVDAPPAAMRARCRYWDRAASSASGDARAAWTAGVLVAHDGARYYVEDVARVQAEVAERDAFIRQVADLDRERDPRTSQVLEQDPGQAGKVEVEHLKRLLDGHQVWSVLPTGDKQTRAAPVASQAHAGNVLLVRGVEHYPTATRWIGPLLAELELFPGGSVKDQVDALSGACAWLSGRAPRSGSTYRGRAERAPAPRYRF